MRKKGPTDGLWHWTYIRFDAFDLVSRGRHLPTLIQFPECRLPCHERGFADICPAEPRRGLLAIPAAVARRASVVALPPASHFDPLLDTLELEGAIGLVVAAPQLATHLGYSWPTIS